MQPSKSSSKAQKHIEKHKKTIKKNKKKHKKALKYQKAPESTKSTKVQPSKSIKRI